MKSIIRNCLLTGLVAVFSAEVTSLIAQETTTEDKKIIITEETTDADGNTITRKITIEGDISSEDLEGLLNDSDIDRSHEIIIGGQRPLVLRGNRPHRNNTMNRHFFHQDRNNRGILNMERNPTLGIYLNSEEDKLVVARVVEDSAADKAGMKEGDILVNVEGKEIQSVKDIQNILKEKSEGDKVNVVVMRDNDEMELSVEVRHHQFHGSVSRTPRWNQHKDQLRILPFEGLQKPKLGVMIQDDENGVLIDEVTKDSAAEEAGLKEGDYITKFNGTEIDDSDHLIELVRGVKGDQTVEIEFEREGEKQTTKAELTGKKTRKRL